MDVSCFNENWKIYENEISYFINIKKNVLNNKTRQKYLTTALSKLYIIFAISFFKLKVLLTQILL